MGNQEEGAEVILWNLQGIFYPTKAWQEKKGGTIGPQQAQRSDRKRKGKQDKIEWEQVQKTWEYHPYLCVLLY